ncbi:hypothetical protein RVBP21_0960 [Pseudomonas phage BRkr]|nr:hypothetical protein RVBP21_0960 [Pseudomonas phage BRkr]
MRFTKIIALFLMSFACIVFGQEVKDPLIYAQTPLFFSTFTPKVAPCFFNNDSRHGVCGWKTWPDEITVAVTRRSKPTEVYSYVTNGNVEVVCIDEYCRDAYGQLVGVVRGHSGTTYWELPRGYYLTMVNNSFTAIKFGNGSLKHEFPIRDLLPSKYNDKKADGETLDLRFTEALYNVYCNVEMERCNYLGKEWTLLELAQLVPFVKTATCDEYLCYIDNRKSQVAGINPARRDIYDGIK